jgi:F-type H+-transporting ATPase subunit epsilon
VALELIVVTPEGQAFSGSVDQVVLPGAEGDFGVLEQHERVLAPLRSGTMEIRSGSGSEWAAISNGFADVGAEQVVVLVDSCQRPADVDTDETRTQLAEVQSELDNLTLGEEDQARRGELESTVAHAAAQLEIAGKS